MTVKDFTEHGTRPFLFSDNIDITINRFRVTYDARGTHYHLWLTNGFRNLAHIDFPLDSVLVCQEQSL